MDKKIIETNYFAKVDEIDPILFSYKDVSWFTPNFVTTNGLVWLSLLHPPLLPTLYKSDYYGSHFYPF